MAVALSVVTVLWALWYVSHHGFSRKWRQVLISEAEKRGVHLTVGRLTLNPFQGLVARDVQIRSSRGRGRAMASINEIVLDINYSNLVHKEAFLNALELRNATLSLPLEASAPKTERLEISDLNARVLLPAHHLTVEHAEAMVRGLRVSASGHFVNPEKFQWSQSRADSDPMLRVRDALDVLDQLKMSGGKPTLEIRFSGDLENPGNLFAEAVLRSSRFTIQNTCHIESVKLALTLAEGRVRIDQCEVKDARGSLDATGAYGICTGEADLQLRSTLDLPGLIRAAHPKATLKELALTQPPLLEMSGSAQMLDGTPKIQLRGRLTLGPFAVQSLTFESAGTDFSWESGGRWYLHNAHIQHQNGGFALNAIQVPGDFRFKLESRIDPAVFLPLVPHETRERLKEWEFRTAPVVHLEGRGPACELPALEITGRAALGATNARGTLLKSALFDLGFKGNVLTCQNIQLERAEGTGSGTVVYDFNTDLLQFQNVRTTLKAVEVVRIFDKGLAEQLLPYRFNVRPALVVNGSVGCRHDDWQRNNLRINVDGAHGMDYTFLKKELSSSKISGTVTVLGDRLKLDDLDATIWGGHLRGKADISLRKAAGDYTAELFTEQIDFPSLTKLYFDYDTSKGKLDGSFAFSGLHDWARAISGKGTLVVTEGNVFAIPIFGPFSSILDEVLPGTGYNTARRGACTFQMQDGVVTTDDLVMEGKGFSILGKGKLFILDDKMDFSARINAQGLAGKLLDPMSHLLEYVSNGSLSKPSWRPKRLPNLSSFTNLPKAIFSPRAQPSPSPEPVSEPGR
ncbi:MAG: hypothetical protein NTZ46_08990 [Verrucomicrobia bacterium]|nr:hypothetical protein [Verrucomicrobiota bacterium]